MSDWPEVSELENLNRYLSKSDGENVFHAICAGEVSAYLLMVDPTLVTEVGPPSTRCHYAAKTGVFRSKVSLGVAPNNGAQEGLFARESRAISSYIDSIRSPTLPGPVGRFGMQIKSQWVEIANSIHLSLAEALARPALDGSVASGRVTGLFKVSVCGAGPLHIASLLDRARYPAGLDVEEFVSVIDQTGRGWRVHAPCLLGEQLEGCSYLLGHRHPEQIQHEASESPMVHKPAEPYLSIYKPRSEIAKTIECCIEKIGRMYPETTEVMNMLIRTHNENWSCVSSVEGMSLKYWSKTGDKEKPQDMAALDKNLKRRKEKTEEEYLGKIG